MVDGAQQAPCARLGGVEGLKSKTPPLQEKYSAMDQSEEDAGKAMRGVVGLPYVSMTRARSSSEFMVLVQTISLPH